MNTGVQEFKQKTVNVSALRFDGGEESAEKIIVWANTTIPTADAKWHKERNTDTSMRPDGEVVVTPRKYPMPEHISVITPLGKMRVEVGDYLILEANGFFPCSKEQFERIYEAA